MNKHTIPYSIAQRITNDHGIILILSYLVFEVVSASCYQPLGSCEPDTLRSLAFIVVPNTVGLAGLVFFSMVDLDLVIIALSLIVLLILAKRLTVALIRDIRCPLFNLSKPPTI
jgi:hypothetical protein